MTRYFRRVIRIKAEDSPNVRLALAELSEGKQPSHHILVPGVLTYAEYLKRRATWDEERQTIGLDAMFYEGKEVMMYPAAWRAFATAKGRELEASGRRRQAKAMSIDSAEGGDSTTFAAGDDLGLMKLLSIKTPDTSDVTAWTIKLGREWGIPSDYWIFDRGGGGKQHADRLRNQGYDPETVSFGEAASLPPAQHNRTADDVVDAAERRTTYFNRRAEMYGMLREAIDPQSENPWGLIEDGPECQELLRQMSLVPLKYDERGRLKLPPKNRRSAKSNEITLTQIIGHSPDELDAVVMLLWRLRRPSRVVMAGAID